MAANPVKPRKTLPTSTGFSLERYAYAADREKFVETELDESLNPEDYWYYKLLDLQTRCASGDDKLVEATRTVSASDLANNDRLRKLLLRQAIKDYSTNPDGAAAAAKDVASPKLDWQKEDDSGIPRARDTQYPSTLQLDTKQILGQVYTQQVDGAKRQLSDVFTPAAATFLGQRNLDAEQIGNYLELIQDEAPAVPYILVLIKKDLAAGVAFGDRKIHRNLTLEQMVTLGDKSDDLWADETFLSIYARKLRPVTESKFDFDLKARKTYFTKLKSFALERIPNDVNASLKALILYNYLTFMETQGVYDVDVYRQYLEIPKAKKCQYAPSSTKKSKRGNTAKFASFSYTVRDVPELKAIECDYKFVDRAAHHFLLRGEKPSAWKKVLDETFASPIFAEEMMCAGKGNEKFQESQLEMLARYKGPNYFKKTLVNRVDLCLTPDNNQAYQVEDEVSLKVTLKNVPQLTVRVYEFNARNFYMNKGSEIPPNINLYGCSPVSEFTIDYGDPPLLKKIRRVNIPDLTNRRGVFIVDLSGSGAETRAFIRKGEYKYIMEQTEKGHIFKVINEKCEPVDTGRIFMSGLDFYADTNGEVTIPFGAVTKDQLIVLDDYRIPGPASLASFTRLTQKWDLKTGFYIDRESLLEKREAKVIIRPNLYLCDETVTIANLTDVQLTLSTTNADDEVDTRVTPLTLTDNQETVCTFIVPTELRQVDLILDGKLGDLALQNRSKFVVNGIDRTESIGDMFLFPYGRAGYVLAVLGKNGEPLANRVVDVFVEQRYVNDALSYTLESDANGRVYLGRLPDVVAVKAKARDPQIYKEQKWCLLEDLVNVPRLVNAAEGSVVKIPFPSVNKNGPKVQIFDANFIADFSKAATYKKCYIEIKGLPTGDFKVFIRDQRSAEVLVQVAGGRQVKNRFGDYVVSDGGMRILQRSEETPLQISSVKGSREKGYTVKLNGFNDKTRVHILSTSFIPRFTAYSMIASPNMSPDVIDFQSYLSVYLPQRPVRSEYKYVVNRKAEDKNVGNLLPFPSFLLNKWTTNNPFEDRDPQGIPPPRNPPPKMGSRFERGRAVVVGGDVVNNEDKSNLEFLAEPSRVYPNVPVGADGTVNIAVDQITSQNNLIQIIAADDDNTAIRNVILEESRDQQKFTDVRLMPGLDPEKHMSEKRAILPLDAGQDYTIDDYKTSDYEPYWTLEQIFRLYTTLALDQDSNLRQQLDNFAFLGNWDNFDEDQKLCYYDKFACNELNFFLYNKDNAFFEKVVKALLADKLQKSFFDLWLLEDPAVNDYQQKYDKFYSLNAFERVLLAKRVGQPGLTRSTLKSLQEASALQVVLPQRGQRIFQLALQTLQLSQNLVDEYLTANPKDPILEDGRGTGGWSLQDGVPPGSTAGKRIEKTRSQEGTNYFQVAFAKGTQDLIKPNRFWSEYAAFALGESGGDSFLSPYFAEATNNVNEILLALAVLDVPINATKPEIKFIDDKSVNIRSSSPGIVFAKELLEGPVVTSAISCHANYFDPEDMTEEHDGETVDKFVRKDFQTSKVYGCRVVLTNVSSVNQTVEVLAQIPTGSIPTGNGFRTKNYYVKMKPFSTSKREFKFYFPNDGSFAHFPTHISKNGKCIGYGLEEKNLNVTKTKPPADRSSWQYISQAGDPAQVLAHLSQHASVPGLELSKICWRLTDEKFFQDVTKILRERQVYSEAVWAHSLLFAGSCKQEVSEYLSLNRDVQTLLSPGFTSDVCNYEGTLRLDFQYLEYSPLVNQKIHQELLPNWKLYNDTFTQQYSAFLNRISYSSGLSTADALMGVSYYLHMDRILKADELYRTVDEADGRATSALGYDLLGAYLSMFDDSDRGGAARGVLDTYADANLPGSKRALLDEIQQALTEIDDPSITDNLFDEATYQAALDAEKPQLEFVKQRDPLITLTYANIDRVTVNFYKLDVETNFSITPFTSDAIAYRFVRPNKTLELKLDASGTQDIKLPRELINLNCLCEMVSGDVQVTKPIYDNDLTVQVAESIGELRVLNEQSNKPLEQVYCKVYGRRRATGEAVFFKDGYTDIRGRFNYRDLSYDQSKYMVNLAVLCWTETMGSTIVEAAC